MDRINLICFSRRFEPATLEHGASVLPLCYPVIFCRNVMALATISTNTCPSHHEDNKTACCGVISNIKVIDSTFTRRLSRTGSSPSYKHETSVLFTLSSSLPFKKSCSWTSEKTSDVWFYLILFSGTQF